MKIQYVLDQMDELKRQYADGLVDKRMYFDNALDIILTGYQDLVEEEREYLIGIRKMMNNQRYDDIPED